MHFVPEDGVYVYFRYTENESVMVISNNTAQGKTIALDRFRERLSKYKTGKDIVSEQEFTLEKPMNIPANTTLIIELNP
jgi:hypothetical protein